MDRQLVINRAREVVNRRAAHLPGLVRAGGFIFRNRQQIADMARSAYRFGRSLYNRSGSATKSSRSSKSSNFKPAIPPGGGGGGGRYRKSFRKSKSTKGRGRYRKGYRKGALKTVIDNLYPLKKQVHTTTWNVNANVGSIIVTSMEIGNYDPGTYSAGLGPQSCNAVKGTNSGSFNAVISAGPTVQSAGIKRQYIPEKMIMTIQNASNSPAEVQMYLCKWRRAEGTAGELRLESKFTSACTAASVSQYPGITPFMLPQFVNQIKVLSSWKRRIGAGEYCIARAKSPCNGPLLYEAVTDEPVTPQWTRGILVIAHGIPVHDATTVANAAIGPCSLNISAKAFIDHRIAQNAAEATVVAQHQSGTVTTAEVGVGNANAPQNFDY